MFAYCNNNPIMRIDFSGCSYVGILDELGRGIWEALGFSYDLTSAEDIVRWISFEPPKASDSWIANGGTVSCNYTLFDNRYASGQLVEATYVPAEYTKDYYIEQLKEYKPTSSFFNLFSSLGGASLIGKISARVANMLISSTLSGLATTLAAAGILKTIEGVGNSHRLNQYEHAMQSGTGVLIIKVKIDAYANPPFGASYFIPWDGTGDPFEYYN